MINRNRLVQTAAFLVITFGMGSTALLASEASSADQASKEQRVRAGQAVDWLPDIIIRESDLLDHDIVTNIQPGHRHLRLSNATANIGDGPLYARGLGNGGGLGGGQTQDVNQRIYRDDGTFWERLAGKFVFHQFHDHIHVENWCNYRLREVLPNNGVGAIVANGGKTSFCILDLDVYNSQLPNFDSDGRFFSCGNTVQGLSVGWADIYSKDLEGQNIDITGLPDGIYWLESEADPEDHFLEQDETNNITRIQVVIGNPGAFFPDAYEPNNTFDSVNARVVGAPNSPLLGPTNPYTEITALGIHQAGNSDIYKFYSNSTGNSTDSVVILFQHSIGDLDLQICNANGSVLRQSDGSTNKEKILLSGLAKGWYFIRVIGYLDATNPYYELRIDPPANNPPAVQVTSQASGNVDIIHGIETLPVTWTSSDPENDERWVTVWMNREPNFTDSAVVIPTSVNTPAAAGSQIVNSSYLDSGLYYVGAAITDGGTTTWDWSAGTVRVWNASTLGVVHGVISDVSAGPIAGVQAEILSPARLDSSSVSGEYSLTQMFPGTYSVRFSGPGFADTVINNVAISSGDTTELNVIMRVFCPYRAGDVNGNGAGPVISDLVYLVSFLFQNGNPPPNPNAANVNGTGGITVADLVYLVTYLFNGGPPPHCPL